MLIREYDTYYGICDGCGAETPVKDDWTEVSFYIANNWSTRWSSERQEYLHFCPNCRDKISYTHKEG